MILEIIQDLTNEKIFYMIFLGMLSVCCAVGAVQIKKKEDSKK